jgi:hypothetical protein
MIRAERYLRLFWCCGIGGRDGWNVEILEQFGRTPCYLEGGNVRYRRHDECEDERRLNGPVTGGVVARRGAEKEVGSESCLLSREEVFLPRMRSGGTVATPVARRPM